MRTIRGSLRAIAGEWLASCLGYVTALTPALALAVMMAGAPAAVAQDTTCASVKIEIKQELTLERQAFDAEMKINNTTDTGVIENVSVEVKVTDEYGTPVAITDNPNDLNAKFYIRLAQKQNIAAVDGTGTVAAKTTAVINWLLIPAPDSAGGTPLGKKYLVGATLRYRFEGEDTVLDVSSDVITVKPLPLLTLDYFLTQDVWADDPLTAEIEPVEPFTLGVRVKNSGLATAQQLKIDSAQPKIVENNQGLLINFQLTGSYVDDSPVQNTLLVDFGDIAAGTSKMGRWNMETTLAGRFTEFSAKFTHADELGGTLTSLIDATNAHFLIRDVRVDQPGRDSVRDFLANDGDIIRVYESDAPDTEVTDRSAAAILTAGTNAAGNASYRVSFPATAGFAYLQLPDPFQGTKALGRILRNDAKEMLTDNVWLSKTRNAQTKQVEYWFNLFDANTSGVYDAEFLAPAAIARPPVVQYIPDHSVVEGQQVAFLVEASSPDGKLVQLAAAPLPTGASFTPQAANPEAPTLASAIFDWTPAVGSAGSYLIVYTASDGSLSASRSSLITVQSSAPPPGPGTPAIVAPLPDAQVTRLKPDLSVQASSNPQDPTTQVQFELYRDEAMTQLVASALVARPAALDQPTVWVLPADLDDNTRYWWRARAFDGSVYSPWANGRFFVNLYNDAPDSFNLSQPAPNAQVTTLTPTLSWTNSTDRDGDAITYSPAVYRDTALGDLVAQASGLAADASGTTSWTLTVPLENHVTYYWRVVAHDALGAQTPSSARPFVVNTGNSAPSAPLLLSPPPGSQVSTATPQLTVQNSVDADNDLITYVFDIDTVNTFDSGNKRSSEQIIQSLSGSTGWVTPSLAENQRYWWRAKAQDGFAETASAVGDFVVNAVNDPPPAPTVRNPGDGAWSATRQPTLEANPVVDPEGDAVSYQFEVYRDAALSTKVAEGSASEPMLLVPAPLDDQTTHWWRVRAVDAYGAAGPWSPAAILYVSTGPYQEPSIAVTAPATPIQPTTVTTGEGTRKQVTLRWEGSDPNIEPTVALYYATSTVSFSGELIVDGLRQASAGSHSGSYLWDVTDLAPGVYYVYGVIYDARSVARAWAPGAVVIVPAVQSGGIVVTPSDSTSSEDGGQATFQVRLQTPPAATVSVPVVSSNAREGVASPASLSFTSADWNLDQGVIVTGKTDCMRDGTNQYQALVGPAVALDPHYMGMAASPLELTNADSVYGPSTAANNPNFALCGLTIRSQRKVDAINWEYVLEGSMGNTGPAVSGVTATLIAVPLGVQIMQPNMRFGALQQGETGRSLDTVTLRSKTPLSASFFQSATGFRWNVTVQ